MHIRQPLDLCGQGQACHSPRKAHLRWLLPLHLVSRITPCLFCAANMLICELLGRIHWFTAPHHQPLGGSGTESVCELVNTLCRRCYLCGCQFDECRGDRTGIAVLPGDSILHCMIVEPQSGGRATDTKRLRQFHRQGRQRVRDPRSEFPSSTPPVSSTTEPAGSTPQHAVQAEGRREPPGGAFRGWGRGTSVEVIRPRYGRRRLASFRQERENS